MKKYLMTVVAASALIFAACGDKEEGDDKEGNKDKTEAEGKKAENGDDNGSSASDGAMSMCDCIEMGEEYGVEMQAAGGDQAKMEEINEKFEDAMNECDKLGEKMQAEMTEEEMKEAMMECM